MRKTAIEQNGCAFVTGATGGLGKAFVYALAKRGYTLILTGRSEEKLCALKRELVEKYESLTVHTYAADLSDEGSRRAMTEAIRAAGLKIALLVNAAGADIQKAFAKYSQEKIAFQCRVNFEAAASLCRFSIENRAERLEIINVSSVSGIYPMPYFAIYSATKGALTSFSVALREELKGKNAAVTAILPGAMPTREDIKAQIKGQGLWGKLAAKSPEWVAEYSLRAVRKNKRKAIPGFWNKVMRVSTACIPASWKLHFIARRWSRISKDAF
ncbi:MAG: SDR family NAD(P)-dependent oxidoreductase [Clostridia bacterium]|nr:SDR family NAD(P)-dependent oxidoreductase [Clostridia bacterium]